tara:strand:- start:1323 stop:1853 length:531 start_codon:yes stop_codon:yes gene_type:complete
MNFVASDIKLLITDVDGVLTDGGIFIGPDGMEFKRFSVFDGVGVAIAKAAGLKIAFISARYSSATASRAKELKIDEIYNGSLNKLPVYEKLKIKYNLSDNNIAYIGDDLIDLSVMKKVACPIAVNNAIDIVKEVSIFVTQSSGGDGAFRDAVDWIVNQQGRMEEVYKRMENHVLSS